MQAVVTLISKILNETSIPSISLHIICAGKTVLSHTGGYATLPEAETEGVLATNQTLYDLASVTKVVAGALIAATLKDQGRLDFSDPVQRFLPSAPDGVRVHHLLDHTSGYPAWRPLYKEFSPDTWGSPQTRQSAIRSAINTPLKRPPGQGHEYSDLGYITLCAVLEAIGGPLQEQVQSLLHQRNLNLSFRPPGTPAAHTQIASTERCPVRGRVVNGEVHDLNTVAMAGVSTHAGLFSTASALAETGAFALACARKQDHLIKASTLQQMWSHKGAGHHKLGWDGISVGASSTGTTWPLNGVGHLGYTGTSLWIAPDEQVVVALCTNRVHPTDDKQTIRAVRPQIHQAISDHFGFQR